MVKRPINGWWTRSVVGHQHQLLEVQLFNHCIDVPHLIRCGIGVPGGFRRFAPPEKIKGDDPARGREPREETIVEMHRVRKAMHQDDGRLFPRILARIDVIGTALYDMFRVGDGLLFGHRFLLFSCRETLYCSVHYIRWVQKHEGKQWELALQAFSFCSYS